MKLLLIYLVIMNVIGFIMMAVDKYKAKHHAWRINEKSFFLISLIGGSLGTIIGMYTFHHKTKHWYFVYGLPIILLGQVGLWILYLRCL
ncbi:MAG: DUF1294 domain-containing protein [Longibaculum muris]|uniref:Uncharacterized membrane protein YsdA (DUF1294 family) n=1 Tax=Longibaculum muris TaxID=1796628 RepID=A0A4R3YS76_9FIRM|nr:DUF1294 domain-containing protein [Longibaculum muris]MBS5369782.1 DUF1294 domain-containing protein [Coprobacillus cateniformis]MCR1888789.1 DUF1294 domain-containing protein [Longibaculum muris]MED9810978.1 DUF1294 domain-containing protein [Longibaculum muris]TCV95330.1 uncharacterized membrane protein YsdA (DUF1294 family) [Longibaculum muris]